MCHGIFTPSLSFCKSSEEIGFSFTGCLIILLGRNEGIMNKIPLETNDGESIIRFRDCFSVRYIQSAALLCRLGYVIEYMQGKTGVTSPDSLLRHEVFILNSLLSSVAFLESHHQRALLRMQRIMPISLVMRKRKHCWELSGKNGKIEKNFDRAPVITQIPEDPGNCKKTIV